MYSRFFTALRSVLNDKTNKVFREKASSFLQKAVELSLKLSCFKKI